MLALMLAALAPLTVSVPIPSQQSNDSQTLSIPGAPAGTTSATFRLSGSFLLAHTVENLTPTTNAGLFTTATCHLDLLLAGVPVESAHAFGALFYPPFPAFDGTLDLRGPSAASAVTLVPFTLEATTITDPKLLALLIGRAPVTLDLRGSYVGTMTHFGSAYCDWGGPGPDVLGLSLTVTYQ